MTIVVSCAGNSVLARRLYEFMLSARFPGKQTGFATDNVADYVFLNADEIEIPGEPTDARIKSVQSVAADFLNHEKNLQDYSITVFEHVITVGIRVNLDRILLSCEMCGYIASHKEELAVHRTSHGIL